ncbi:hypothetical protein HN51_005726, partial [Arachis hypogaea]
DSFLRCFKSIRSEPRNWNIYLFFLWCFGVVIRYLVLFLQGQHITFTIFAY